MTCFAFPFFEIRPLWDAKHGLNIQRFTPTSHKADRNEPQHVRNTHRGEKQKNKKKKILKFERRGQSWHPVEAKKATLKKKKKKQHINRRNLEKTVLMHSKVGSGAVTLPLDRFSVMKPSGFICICDNWLRYARHVVDRAEGGNWGTELRVY